MKYAQTVSSKLATCVSTACIKYLIYDSVLTHWGRVTHIYVGILTIVGSDNGLSPSRHQFIIWTNAGILLIGPLETNFSDFFYQHPYIFIQENVFENVTWKMEAILLRPQCVKENPLKYKNIHN